MKMEDHIRLLEEFKPVLHLCTGLASWCPPWDWETYLPPYLAWKRIHFSSQKIFMFCQSEDQWGRVLTDRWASTDCYSPSSRSRLQRWAGLQPARGRQQKLVSSGETRTPIQPHQDTSTVQRLLNHFHMQCCKGSLMAGPHSLAVSFLKKQIIQAPQIGRNTPKNWVHFLMWEVIQMTWVGLFGSLKTQRNS